MDQRFSNILLLVILLGIGAETPIRAQGENRSELIEMMLRQADANENGMIEPDEWGRLPQFRDWLLAQGADLRSPQTFAETAAELRGFLTEMQARDSGGTVAPAGTLPTGAARTFGPSSSPRGPQANGAIIHTANSFRENAGKEPPRPFLFSLPEKYRGRDTNGDGQIGMYEWPPADLNGFAALDLNRDGFITPAELALVEKGAKPSAPQAVPRWTPPSGTPPLGSRGSPGPPGSSAAGEDPQTKRATWVFQQLDRNKNNQVDASEWQQSRTTRPLFEKAGIDISGSMPKDEFLKAYLKLTGNAGR